MGNKLMKNKLMLTSIFVGLLVSLAFHWFNLNILWTVVGEDGNIGGVALIIATSYILTAFYALIEGYIVDRFPKKKTIVVTLFICTILTFGWLLVDYMLLVAVIAYLAIDFFISIHGSSLTALLAEKFEKNEYIRLNAIGLITNNVVYIINRLIAAVFILVLDQTTVIIIIAATLSIATILYLILLPESDVEYKKPTEKVGNPLSKLKHSVRESWNFAKLNVFNDKRIVLYIVILFFLNLDYAFIPLMLPLHLMTITDATLIFVVIMGSGNDIGEIFAAGLITKYGHLVSRLTKIGLAGSALTFAVLPFVYTMPVAVVGIFIAYGFFDTLTQPYYDHFVTSLDDDKRGRILGIVSAIVLLASPLGVLIGTLLAGYGMIALTIGIVFVFVVGLLVISASKSFGNIKLAPVNENESGDDD
ncbi:MAG: MFS transporter [Defluviitaleaceae bacterium]|nr:MFS transporter [Defluviitaleaceae bacterium]